MLKVIFFSVLFFHSTLWAKNSLLLENVTIVSSHLVDPLLNMNVLIENGRIIQITKKRITSKAPKINGFGKYLTPGIMDSHVHVSSIPGMGFGVDPVSVKHPNLAKAYYKQQPLSFLFYGVTQILDPNPGLTFKHFTSAKNHPDYFRCEVITSKNTFPYVEKQDDKSRSLFSYLIDENAEKNLPNSAEDIVLRISKTDAVCIKLYFEDGYGNDSQWSMLAPKTLQRIKLSADKANLPILAHANALDMQQLALAAGADVIAHGMWNWGEHARAKDMPAQIKNVLNSIVSNKIGFMPTQRVIAGLGEIMQHGIASSAAFLAITPKPLLDWYTTPKAQWFKEELRIGFDGLPDETISEIFLYGRVGKGNQVINYLNESKHPILLASDFPGSPSFANQPGLTTFQEMKALEKAGLSLKEVMAAATINNAKQFNIHNDYGTVEIGKIANLLLLKENPLSNIEAWNSIEIIILHGEPIQREYLSIKY
jgi:imidazolonepropionase-like amidohydrolase